MACIRLSFVCLLLHLAAWCAQTPAKAKELARQGFAQRWEAFHGDTRVFSLWTPQWKEDELKKRYYAQFSQERKEFYAELKKTFKANGHSKKTAEGSSMSAPFMYNAVHSGYNGSIVTLGGKQFLAVEAPTKRNQSEFFEILREYAVTDLVRIAPLCEGGCEKMSLYWEGRINIGLQTKRPTIVIDGCEINYVETDFWPDQEGIDEDRLIALVKVVMANPSPQQVVAVHCHAGIGRTGTFLAAYELIRQIDEQLAHGVASDQIQVSVDKVLWELSLQRMYAVSSVAQYITLYKLVGTYLGTI